MGKWRELAEKTCSDIAARKETKRAIELKVKMDIDVMTYQRRSRYIRKKSKAMYQSK